MVMAVNTTKSGISSGEDKITIGRKHEIMSTSLK
jgi:hypothetical protein